MLKGDPVTEGWRADAVKDSLELCLSCKGCTGDCPVQVDMPTYKAEFLSHYYEGRRRPVHHYLMGGLPWWGRVAARVPRLANAVSHSRWLAPPGKRLIGLAEERPAPRFADETFRSWHRRVRGSEGSHGDRPPVVLWADTFTNLFDPEIGIAALEVLDAAGFAPLLSPPGLCCGRPLYDFGMLEPAKRALRRVLDALSVPLEMGWPVLVLEPSCASVLRDELRKLMPEDERAQRLVSQTVLLDELLHDWEPPQVRRRALLHGHCHQEALMGIAGERDLLARAGVEVEVLNSGCCGLAGSFGYVAGDQYEVSMRAGERVLLPAVRSAPEDSLVVADGFSCRTQISTGTGRRALHSAQVLALGLSTSHSG
jgi:Fe-S oxidoreductase